MGKAIEAHNQFRKKWKIDPTDPDIFDSDNSGPDSKVCPFLRENMLWVTDCPVPGEQWSTAPGVVSLNIDTKGPLKDLLDYIEWRIRREKALADIETPAPQRHRPRPKHYQDYLAAYDLSIEKKSPEEIATDLNIPKETALRYLNRANQIIAHVEQNEWP
jgi:hypothetical protein